MLPREFLTSKLDVLQLYHLGLQLVLYLLWRSTTIATQTLQEVENRFACHDAEHTEATCSGFVEGSLKKQLMLLLNYIYHKVLDKGEEKTELFNIYLSAVKEDTCTCLPLQQLHMYALALSFFDSPVFFNERCAHNSQ